MPMRVKTPWIDALTQSREAAKAGSQENAAKAIKPDLTPKKMSDSAYSAVCYSSLWGLGLIVRRMLTTDIIGFAIGSRQVAFGFLPQLLRAYQVCSRSTLSRSMSLILATDWDHC
jgi:hypothetical protein